MRYGINYILLILGSSLLWSCSTQKNTKASRFYHAFTTRYNVYYNGKVSFDEQLDALNSAHQDNYTDMILMYPVSAKPKDKTTPGGPFDRAIEKSEKAIKLHSINAKPEKKPGWRSDPKQVALQAKEEYNPFLKNSWLMLGQAQFYNTDFLQAAATFSYISRHYATEPEVATEARMWQARCYTEMGWFYEAEDVLHKLNQEGFPKKNLDLYSSVYANYLIQEGKFEEAVPYLEIAIKAEKNKLQRTRMRYLLGQIYTDLGLDNLAYSAYGKVINSAPPYELEFAARIRQTEVFAGTNYQKVVKQLERMAKSSKNTDYLDQVYYALGNIHLSRQDTANAIVNYQLGIDKSVRNGMDKAICQIKLGDIYFAQRDYIKAQPCFSGAMSIIQKEYKEYERVSKLSSVLDELVIHAEAVHLQDSLQIIARMPEEERLAVIDKIIAQVAKEEEESRREAAYQERLAQQGGEENLLNPDMAVNMAMLPSVGDGSFYFYNPQIVTQGRQQFQRVWGRRTLEDDWRRRNKRVTTFTEDEYFPEEQVAEMVADEEGNLVPADSQTDALATLSSDPKSRDYYLQQLPLTPEDMEASDIIIEDGLYNMAKIYKDKLEDLPLSIDGFQTLEQRYPDNNHRLESFYQIYLMALRLNDTALAAEYRNKLITAFPESSYAVAVADPNYEYNIRMMDRVQDSIYQRTYDHYLNGDVNAVRQYYSMMNETYPLATLLPKFMFLDALTNVQTGDVNGFKEALQALLEKYPAADVSELAGEMLKGVLRGRELVQGNVRGMTWNMRFGGAEISAADAAREFTAETNTLFRVLLIYPAGSLNDNQLLYAVAAYNFSNFIVKELDLELQQAGPVSMLNITGFYNFNEVNHYYQLIYGENGYAAPLTRDLTVIPISEDNYEVLMRGKSVDEYIDFFEEHFAELAPEMLVRWSTRREADMMEVEEAERRQEAARTEPTEDAPAVTEPVREEPVEAEEHIPAEQEFEAIVEQAGEQLQQQETPEQEIIEPAPVEEEVVMDTIPTVQPTDTIQIAPPAEELGLTLKDIEEIRKQEAIIEAARQDSIRLVKEAEEELKKQREREREEQLKLQREEEANKRKSAAERQKQLERERKEKLKQAEAERKAKEKARAAELKQKEKEYKERLKQREAERKQKEKEYRERQKQREKEQAAARKAREAAARNR